MVLEEFDEEKLEELAKGLPEFGRFGKELETIGVLPIPNRLRRYHWYNQSYSRQWLRLQHHDSRGLVPI